MAVQLNKGVRKMKNVASMVNDVQQCYTKNIVLHKHFRPGWRLVNLGHFYCSLKKSKIEFFDGQKTQDFTTYLGHAFAVFDASLTPHGNVLMSRRFNKEDFTTRESRHGTVLLTSRKRFRRRNTDVEVEYSSI